MSTPISTRLVSLRKEKNLSQKQAAEALGVSQGLLSHYEKGIRECGLDFLCRAANFYDVSSDYLLGLSETKMMSDALFAENEIPQDSEIRMSTVFRASVYLMDRLGAFGKNYSNKIRMIYILTIYRIYLCAISQSALPNHECAKKELSPFMISAAIDQLINSFVFEGDAKPKRTEQLPKTMDTVLREGNRAMEKEISKIYKTFAKNQSNSL